jgi:hypothetical protein
MCVNKGEENRWQPVTLTLLHALTAVFPQIRSYDAQNHVCADVSKERCASNYWVINYVQVGAEVTEGRQWEACTITAIKKGRRRDFCTYFKSHFTFRALQFNYYNLSQQMHTTVFKLDVCGSVHRTAIHTEKSNKMQKCIKILLFRLHEAQHVSGDPPPIIRSLKLH